MTAARDHILGTIRESLKRGPLSPEQAARLEGRLRTPPANPIPARGRIEGDRRTALFIAEAERVDATVARLAAADGIPGAIAEYLAEKDLPKAIKVAPDALLENAPWSLETALGVSFGRAEDADAVGVAVAFAGIAETGTLMMLSGAAGPATLNLLPDTHVVVLPVSRLAGTYEEAWVRLRGQGDGGDFMPRAVTWITGPSRTADIEQTLMLGAHGPRRLHILLLDGQGS